jgi:[acyl-carrier-protein] S-malonyltransferase
VTGLAAVAHHDTGNGQAATVIGYVDGRPVPRAALERRRSAMRAGSRSATLPAPGSPEDRQLARWLTQVILSEMLCDAEAGARGLALDRQPDERLDPRAAVEHGSITAAAYRHSPAVRAVCAAVTAEVRVAEDEVRRYWEATAGPMPARWVLRHRLNDGAPHVIGPVGAADLPAALGAALTGAAAGGVPAGAALTGAVVVGGVPAGVALTRAAAVGGAPAGRATGDAGAAPGDTVTAVDRLGRHEAHVLDVLPARVPCFEREAPAVRRDLLAAARRRAFAHWLDRARAGRIRLVPGLEHPGDPRQPDNHHRH